jgi:hypothetical protein
MNGSTNSTACAVVRMSAGSSNEFGMVWIGLPHVLADEWRGSS